MTLPAAAGHGAGLRPWQEFLDAWESSPEKGSVACGFQLIMLVLYPLPTPQRNHSIRAESFSHPSGFLELPQPF